MKPYTLDPQTCGGYGVYVVEANDGRKNRRLTKIGMSGTMARRMVHLATACPHELKLRYWIPCEDKCEARWLERLAHNHWHVKRHRVSGEWFDMPRGDIAMIGPFIEAMQDTGNDCFPYPQGTVIVVTT